MDGASHAALQGCVASLRSSMQLLDSSINILDAGVSDYPRLSKVLQTTRHFELVSEPSLRTAQQTLLSSLEPELDNLLSRVEVHLDKLARREQSLMAKAELQEGRLSNASRPSGGRKSPAAARGSVGAGEALTEAEMRRLTQLRQKKERLSYAVGRLELQSTQRERQLRKSMAAQ
ncbi:DASH complex subunit spc19 [Oleoguttula sp. CCFEE 5521]